MANHWTPFKLLNSKDINGNYPEIYMVVSTERAVGKTWSISKFLVDAYFLGPEGIPELEAPYFEKGAKFVLQCRTKNQLGSYAQGMMKLMLAHNYPGYTMYEVIKQRGVYSEVYMTTGIGDEKSTYHVGYVVPLNSASDIKNISSTFGDAAHRFMDEFTPEFDSTYTSEELTKYGNIHGSMARGDWKAHARYSPEDFDGQNYRYFPTIMAANTISIENPYFRKFGLSSKIQEDTKFYKGGGVVYERATNKALAKTQAETPFQQAFNGGKVVYNDNSWINDDRNGITNPNNWGRATYICTLIDGSNRYAVKHYRDVDLFYIDYKVDNSSKYVYNLHVNGELNVQLINSTGTFTVLRDRLFKGLMRFKNLQIKNVMMELLL